MDTDFCGFSFNGHHSFDMGFLRVSDGSRYNEDLIPSFQDKTVPIPGRDGTYFFESYYSQKPFNIPIAFDSMTEKQFRTMRQVFNGKDVGPLVFDEAPYKAYVVKVQSPPQLKYICFEEDGTRVYKGEGTLQFISYAPYAHSVYKFLNEYDDALYPNKSQWSIASGMLLRQGNYDQASSYIRLYNPGDVETDFRIYYPIGALDTLTEGSLELFHSNISAGINTERLGKLTLRPIHPEDIKDANDAYVCIDSKTNLIEGCANDYQPTGTLYNDHINSGSFFKIPISNTGDELYMTLWVPCSLIQYHYLYY